MTARTEPDIFLSYSRQDLAVAGQMAAALQAAGHSVWWDQALKAGEVYDKVTEAALLEARLVVVLWSKASVGSDWVRSEATVALQRNALVPVMMEDCRRPVMFELRQSADLIGWKGNTKDPRLVAFVADVTRQLGAPVTAKAVPVPAMAPKPDPSRRLLIGGAAGAAVLAAGGFGAWRAFGGKPDDGTASVVVLPFANLSGDPAQAYFSDGIAEELRNALSQIRGLKVIGRVSSETFRDTDDLSAAAEKLGVDHVLTGSVRRSPTTIRIGAQLVDGRTGVESWSQSYDQPIGDSLAIQSKIATSVVAALSAKLGAALGAITVGGTRDAEAQALFLRAQSLFFQHQSQAGFEQIRAMAEAAIARDPGYSDAWSALTIAKANLALYASNLAEGQQLYAQSVMASRRAVALAPMSGLALSILAVISLDMLAVRSALDDGRRALSLAPSDARVINSYCNIVQWLDADHAVSASRRAVELDPFNAAYLQVLSSCLLCARQYEEANRYARQALTLSNNQRGGIMLCLGLLALNRLDEARASLGLILVEAQRLSLEATIADRAGDHAAAEAAISALRKRGDRSVNYLLACVHAGRRHVGPALASLEASLQLREPQIGQITFDFRLDPIRREPRFKAVRDAVIPPDLFVPPKALRQA